MGSKYHTIIVVPHERAKFRKWRVSSFQIVAASVVLLATTFGAGLVSWLSVSRHFEGRELARLRQENAQLRNVNLRFESSVDHLQRQLSDFETRTRKLAIVAGIESLSSSTEAGIGGLELNAREGVASRVGEIGSRLASLEGSLGKVEAKLDERRRWISATPAILPVQGLFASGFGARPDPITGRPAFHEGIDIAAAPGKPVHAGADGVVVKAEMSGGLGLAVILSHGFGLSTRYGHLSKVNVVPGQRVKRGDVVGFVGTSGRSTGYHLHYEVLVDGEPVNPLAYVLDAAANSSS